MNNRFDSMISHLRVTISALFAVLAGSILMSFLHTKGNLFLAEYLEYYLWFVPFILMIEVIRYRRLSGIEETTSSINIAPGVVLFVFLLLALCSSHNEHPWFYFIEWRHGHVPGFYHFKAGIIRFIFLTQILVPYFLFSRKKISLVTAVITVFFILLCSGVFLWATKGQALYRDDHACFIYRLWEFSKTFPQFINYNPDWNAGAYDCSIVTTGAVSLGFLFWPLWKIFSIEAVYTYACAVSFIALVPLLCVFSLRIIGGSWTSAWCAGLLSIGVSQHYFVWLFCYGTPGALLTSAFLVPFASCVFRVIWLDKREWWLAVVLVLTAFFLVMWPPGVIMGTGVLLSVIFSFWKWSKKKILFLVLCFIAFFILYFKIFAIIAGPAIVSDVSTDFYFNSFSSFLSILNYKTLVNGWHHLGGEIQEGHHLLIFFGLGGIFFLTQRGVRYWYLPILIFLMILSGWGSEFTSELQLTRMCIPMFFVSVVPASLWIGRLISIKRARLSLLQAALVSLLVLGGWSCVQMYKNRGFARYITILPEIRQMAEWIQKNVPQDGRLLFAGPTLHAYGNGHAVVLPYLAKREMLAADYVQFSTTPGVEYFPPVRYRDSKEELFRYMDLYNITHVVTWDENYKEIFRAYPDQYREEVTIAEKTFFTVNRNSTMFLRGSGTVKSDFNLIQVHTDNPEEDIVIKYNWLDGLSVEEPAEILPYDAGDGIKFIGIHPNGQKDIFIRFKSWR